MKNHESFIPPKNGEIEGHELIPLYTLHQKHPWENGEVSYSYSQDCAKGRQSKACVYRGNAVHSQ
jgi:hypothetical protein